MALPMVSGSAMRRGQSGFGYLLVLLLIALLGMGLGAAGTLWSTESQRVKESDLLYVGEQYRKAIRSYYNAPSPDKARHYPKKLEDLLLDTRQPQLTRYLRKLYVDPVSGKNEWGLIVDETSRGISGVYSLAPGTPLKQLGFDAAHKDFENAPNYAAWHFVVTEAAQPAKPAPKTSAEPAPVRK